MLERDYERLDDFLVAREADIAPEPFCMEHEDITARVIETLDGYGLLKNVKTALDVGPGPGFAIKKLSERGIVCTGIDLFPDGGKYPLMDQSFLDFPPETFDLVWARHVLEHSVMPYFTLAEYFRVMRNGGIAYIEVPAPETECQHEFNRNHYAVMGAQMWASLMVRAGFGIERTWAFELQIPQAKGGHVKDKYLCFLLKKKD